MLFCCFHKSANGEKVSFFNLNDSEKCFHLPALCETAFYDLRIVAVLLANTGKFPKISSFESVYRIWFLFKFEIYSFVCF